MAIDVDADLQDPPLPRPRAVGIRIDPMRVVVGLAAVVLGLVSLTWDGLAAPATPPWFPVAVLVLAVGTVAGRARARAAGVLAVAIVAAAVVAVVLGDVRTPPLDVFGIGLGVLLGVAGVALGAAAFRGERRRGDRLVVAAGAVVLGVVGVVTPRQVLWLGLAVASLVLVARGAGGVIATLVPPDDVERSWVVRWLGGRTGPAEERARIVRTLSFEGPDAGTRFGRFAALMAFAAALAALGVVLDSTAVVIGAMLVAPLMTPLMACALSLAQGWPRRAARAALVAVAGVCVAVAVGAFVAAAIPVPLELQANPQVLSRTAPTLIDLAVAVAAGAAGGFALARPDVSDALPGVAVAISLVPPLTVVGILLVDGDVPGAVGAALLFATNATAILGAGAAMFSLTGVVPVARLRAALAEPRAAVLTAALLVPILAGLLLTGQGILEAGVNLTTVQSVVATWVEDQPARYRIDTVDLDGAAVTARITGPPTPLPDVDELRERLAVRLGPTTTVDVELTPRLLLEGR